jgi:hypothetical protein
VYLFFDRMRLRFTGKRVETPYPGIAEAR